MKWEHINNLQRKAIVSGLAHNKSLKEIAEIVELDPTSISKEIIRNRIKTRMGKKPMKFVKKSLDFLDAAMAVQRNIMNVNMINTNIKLISLNKKLIED